MKMRLILVSLLTVMLMAKIAEANSTPRGDIVTETFQGMYDVWASVGGDDGTPPKYDPAIHRSVYGPYKTVVPDPVYVSNPNAKVLKPLDCWYRMHACLLLWLLPFALFGMISALGDKIIFFDDAGEPAVITACYFGLWILLLFTIDRFGVFAISGFWLLTLGLVIWNIHRTMQVNPRNPAWSIIIGIGKLPASVMSLFFIWVWTFGTYSGTPEQQMNAKVNDLIKAGALALLLSRLVNGDRVRSRRMGFNPYGDEAYGYSN